MIDMRTIITYSTAQPPWCLSSPESGTEDDDEWVEEEDFEEDYEEDYEEDCDDLQCVDGYDPSDQQVMSACVVGACVYVCMCVCACVRVCVCVMRCDVFGYIRF